MSSKISSKKRWNLSRPTNMVLGQTPGTVGKCIHVYVYVLHNHFPPPPPHLTLPYLPPFPSPLSSPPLPLPLPSSLHPYFLPHYPREKNRFPAWCDRILYSKNSKLKPKGYGSHPALLLSDHKPVSALYDAVVSLICTRAGSLLCQEEGW